MTEPGMHKGDEFAGKVAIVATIMIAEKGADMVLEDLKARA